MARYPDKYFDLAVVDPPYGIGASKKTSYHKRGFQKYKKKMWDEKIPDENYFKELFRVSKEQIIWGGNYFTAFLPISAKWIIWDKKQPEGIDQAMYEMAYNSNQKIQAKIYRQSAQSNSNKATNKIDAKKNERIHQNQKPIPLYDWIYKNYLPYGGKVLDSHLGSGSNRIAADKAGNIEFTAFELDEDHFNDQEKRWKNYKSQLTIF